MLQLLSAGGIKIETKRHGGLLLKEELMEGFEAATFALEEGGQLPARPGILFPFRLSAPPKKPMCVLEYHLTHPASHDPIFR